MTPFPRTKPAVWEGGRSGLDGKDRLVHMVHGVRMLHTMHTRNMLHTRNMCNGTHQYRARVTTSMRVRVRVLRNVGTRVDCTYGRPTERG